jgi:hypothetical protein
MKKIIITIISFIFLVSWNIKQKEKKSINQIALIEKKEEKTENKKNTLIAYNFSETVAMLESSGKLDTINRLGYIGLYQFGSQALKDLGVSKKRFVKLNKKYLTSKMGMDWLDIMDIYGYNNFQLIYACHRHGAGNVAIFFKGGQEHKDGNGKPVSQVKELFLPPRR